MGCTISSSSILFPIKKKGDRRFLLTGVGGCGGGCGVGGVGGGGGRSDAVVVCKERTRLVKKAVKQRRAFAEAHYKYFQSLSAVSAALSIFISGHNHLPPPPSSSSCSSSDSASQSCGGDGPQSHHLDSDPVEEELTGDRWDFFDILGVENKGNDERVAVKAAAAVVVEEEERESCGKGRELWEALKDVEDHFLRASQSGTHLSAMFDLPFHPLLPKQGTPSKKGFVATRSEFCKTSLSPCSTSTCSTSTDSTGDRKSLLSCSSDNSSTWMDNRTDPVGHCGMVSGSHCFTLERLYAWEKKLYHEVKAGDKALKTYKRRCSHLQQKDVEGDAMCPSKATAEVTDPYHLMLVALQRADLISKQIEKLRDEELQPQLLELLHGLMVTWKLMFETHKIQKRIMREIKSLCCPDLGKFYNDSHHLATLELEAAIRKWHSCFSDYVSAQKAYVNSLKGWLSKYDEAEAEYHHHGSSSLPQTRFNGSTLLTTCSNWLASLDRLPDESVKYAMKSLAEGIQALRVQQGIQQKHMRKADGIAKEMDRKTRTFKKAEDKALVVTSDSSISQCSIKDEGDCFKAKYQVAMCRKKLEKEQEKYCKSVQETERLTMNRLQMGFFSVFESLADFSRASVNLYADLVMIR